MIQDRRDLVVVKLLLEGLVVLLSGGLELLGLHLLVIVTLGVSHLVIAVLGPVRVKAELPMKWLTVDNTIIQHCKSKVLTVTGEAVNHHLIEINTGNTILERLGVMSMSRSLGGSEAHTPKEDIKSN